MGQKLPPRATRLGYIQDWESRWLSLRDMPALIGEDFRIRQLVKERFRLGAVSWVGIERRGSFLIVYVHTARPGVVIGKKGVDIEALRTAIEGMTTNKVDINVMEIKEPELDPRLVAEAIAMQLEKRIAHRRAIKRAIERTMQAGALGIKVMVGGRLGGSEIARREWYREGRVPMHTFSADIDYGLAEAHTTMGLIGVKVYIFKRQLFMKNPRELLKEARAAAPAPAPEAAAPAPAPAPAAAAAPQADLPASALAQLEGREPGTPEGGV